jgi:hypothetical protein
VAAPSRLLQRWGLALWALAAANLVLSSQQGPSSQAGDPVLQRGQDSSSCIECHAGIEAMHPKAELSCVDCHGGDGSARSKFSAHIVPRGNPPSDERVAGLKADLAYRRFKNPMDLRVASATCGSCHKRQVDHLAFSLHGTTAGHLSDGFFEVGLLEQRRSVFSIFPVNSFQTDEGEIDSLVQIQGMRHQLKDSSFAKHFSDLARKECMQCHLYSRGRAVEGRVGFDGDYRGEGCAACHVAYATNGLSESADRKATRNEPGHPTHHELQATPTTQTCTTCHYGDASIGMHFRGLSQLPPGAPGGPDIPGTTDTLLYRGFYLNDPDLCPPDIHHERGMHCVDCHTTADVMGDGALHGKMEQQVEISCEACHGDLEAVSNLRTERGSPLTHLHAEGERVFLTSKVTGRIHEVPQTRHVVDPESPRYNAKARAAMTSEHANLECYVCHAGWNVNFLGFHFDRNETLSQLDLISGKRTPGRVTTQEKVFSTWKSFYAGFNEKGRLAPYMTGFSTMGSVTNAEGKRILDQVMPVTANGLSGLTMIHHQTHSVRPESRACVECHRSPQTFGLGSVNFRLARQLAFVADRRGVEVVALDRGQLTASIPLARVVLPDVIDLVVLCDDLQGLAQFVFAAEGGRGVHVIDVRDPLHPRRVAFSATVRPRGLALSGDHLFVADGEGGLKIFDVTKPSELRLVGQAPSFDAHAVKVQWPWAYLADGSGGLAIYDVRAPVAPRLISAIGFGREGGENIAIDLSILFQYSRPPVGGSLVGQRTEARNLCAVVDEQIGLVLVDVTEPRAPRILFPDPVQATRSSGRRIARSVVLQSHVDLAEAQGGSRTTERDYAYVLFESRAANGRSSSELQILDIGDPNQPRRVSRQRIQGSTEMAVLGSFYNTPFLQPVMLLAGEEGVLALDVLLSSSPSELGSLPFMSDTYAIAIEEFPLDAMRDSSGRALKDVSHEPSRWLFLSEIERLLFVPAQSLGLLPEEGTPAVLGHTARLLASQLDKNRDGFISDSEASPALLASADASDDGRVTLLELAQAGGGLGGRQTKVPVDSIFLASRVTPDGDLSRLLDGVDPHDFDDDDDGRLMRPEFEAAVFAALDLDGNRRLSRAEYSRYPGSARQVRYTDEGALERWLEEDLNRDGSLDWREFDLGDAEWEAVDVDRDDSVALPYDMGLYERRRRGGPIAPEWPRRRARVYALPPNLSSEMLLRVLDRSGDAILSTRELKRRRDLLLSLDSDLSGSLEEGELRGPLNLISRLGVEAVADDFEARWDLDGDGRVDDEELPITGGLRVRLFGEQP